MHGFHGKPVPAAVKDEMVAELEKLVAQPSGVKLTPPPPAEDTKPTNFKNITLSSPPDYELGKKVGGYM